MNDPEAITNGTNGTGGGQGAAVLPESQKKLSLIGLIVLALLLGTCLYSPMALEQLLLGWIYFPLRVVPQISVDWPTVCVGAVCLAAFFLGLHRTVRWQASRDFEKSTLDVTRIGFRTTLSLTVLLLLMFASGTAMVGVAHQLAWLITGRKAQTAEQQTVTPPVHSVVMNARTRAQRTHQKNNLKQIGLSVHNLHEAWSTLPPGGTTDDRGHLMHGWAISLAYHASYSAEGIDFGVPWNEPPNDRLYRCALSEFINPAIPEIFDNDGYGLSHVAGNVHVLPISRVPVIESPSSAWAAVMAARTRDDADRRNLPLRIDDVHDGTSNTLLIGESAGRFRPWGHPANVRDPALGVGKSLDGFGGPLGTGGALFLLVDGSVRSISDQVDSNIAALPVF